MGHADNDVDENDVSGTGRHAAGASEGTRYAPCVAM
jgi:hypothetical protein